MSYQIVVLKLCTLVFSLGALETVPYDGKRVQFFAVVGERAHVFSQSRATRRPWQTSTLFFGERDIPL